MAMHLLVVMNPSAHDFEAQKRWPQLRPRLESGAPGGLTLVETQPDDQETEARIQRALKQGCDRVLAIGGDGTVHLVVNAIMRAGLTRLPQLAVIPFGTANNVSRSLQLPLSDLDALTSIAVGDHLTGLDVGHLRASHDGTVQECFWINCVGMGMDADVVAARGKHRELGGYLGYAAALVERTVEQRSMDVHLTVDGRRVDARAFNVIINNVPIYAGTLAMPGSLADDGLLDVYLHDRLQYGSKVLSFAIKQADILGLGVSEMLENVTDNEHAFHGKAIRIRVASPRRFQVDGEARPEASELECRVAGQLQVTVP